MFLYFPPQSFVSVFFDACSSSIICVYVCEEGSRHFSQKAPEVANLKVKAGKRDTHRSQHESGKREEVAGRSYRKKLQKESYRNKLTLNKKIQSVISESGPGTTINVYPRKINNP